jgi:hypothetical protein
MAHSQVLDRGDSLQICRVAANILNKQFQTANRGCISNLKAWVGGRANNPTTVKIQLVTKCSIDAQTWTDS